MFDIRFKAAKSMFFDRALIKIKVDTATRKRLAVLFGNEKAVRGPVNRHRVIPDY